MLDFITSSILRNPPVLLGLIAAIGLILQKSSFADVVKGAFLAAIGMVIIDTGVGIIAGIISPISTAFTIVSGGVVGEGLSDATFTATYGGEVGIAMFIALGIHLLIARFTKFKTVFLTGHMMWWFPFIFVAAGVEGGLSGVGLIAFAAICSALYFSIMPWLLRKYVFDVTGEENFTLGHPTGVLSLLSGFIASKVGNKEKSTEDLNIPEGLSFFREITITATIVMFLMYLVIGLCVPGCYEYTTTLFTYSMAQALTFGAGIAILMQGVRMLVNQIVPAFKGISEKIVPDAIPAFDCPMIFSYKPNALMIGFLISLALSTVLVIVFNVTNLFGVILIPLVFTSFFELGTAAIIAEGQGGVRGCIIGTTVAAIVAVVAMALSVMVYNTTIANWMLVFGGNDFSIFGGFFGWIAKLIGGVA